MNLFGSAVGGVPMCHGAGGMAGHVAFGARTGGSVVILGALLLLVTAALSVWNVAVGLSAGVLLQYLLLRLHEADAG
jgi:Molybdate transporter of MFS superfamily